MAQLNEENIIGVEYIVAFGSRFHLDYLDKEPTDAPLTTSNIKGTVTGVPKLGSGFMLAFVGVEIDVRNFGASAAPNDWGTTNVVVSGAYTATYTRPGLYYISVKDSHGHALATRQVRVLYQRRPSDVSGLTIFDFPFPVTLDGSAQGTLDMGFAFKMKVDLQSLDYMGIENPFLTSGVSGDYIQYQAGLPAPIQDKTLVGIFCIDRNEINPKPKLLCGGFIAARTLTVKPGDASSIEFTAYGPLYWLLQADMREQYYIDPGLIAMNQGVQAEIQVNGGDPLTDDVLGVGYVANHWIYCSPTVCAMHVLQHVRCYYGSPELSSQQFSYPNPTMATPTDGQGQTYGTLGQFMDIIVDDPHFDEMAGATLAGYQDFGVTNGKVLSNIRQLVDNEGWQYYDRHDLRQYFGRKPWFRFTFVPTTPGEAGSDGAPSLGDAPYASLWYPDWVAYWKRWKTYRANGGSQPIPQVVMGLNTGPGNGAVIVGETLHYRSAKQAYDDVIGSFYSNGHDPKPPGNYVFSPPDPVLELHGFAGLPDGGEGVQIQASEEKLVSQIRVEKPPLGMLSDMLQTEPPSQDDPSMSGLPSDLPPPNPRNPFGNTQILASYHGQVLTPQQKAQYVAAPFATSQNDGNAGNSNFTQDPASAFSLNPQDYLDVWPPTPRDKGTTIGPERNVFTLSGVAYAQGRDKQERCRWRVRLPLGQMFGIGLGDYVKIWHYDFSMGINWYKGKLFQIVAMELITKPYWYFLWADAVEVDPDDGNG